MAGSQNPGVKLEEAFLQLQRLASRECDTLLETLRMEEEAAITRMLAADREHVQLVQGYVCAIRDIRERLLDAESRVLSKPRVNRGMP